MADSLILEVKVELDREHIAEFTGPLGQVKMLPFTGTVTGEIFTGTVLPGGVDTQVTDQNQVRRMSARYMLEGKDREGTPCHIYVENEGWFTNGEHPHPFRTVPTFRTDSAALAPYLHRNCFRGEGHTENGQLTIKFYEIQ